LWFIRWRWALYHFLSAFTTIIVFALLLVLLFPEWFGHMDDLAVVLTIVTVGAVASIPGAVLGALYSGRDIPVSYTHLTLPTKRIV